MKLETVIADWLFQNQEALAQSDSFIERVKSIYRLADDLAAVVRDYAEEYEI